MPMSPSPIQVSLEINSSDRRLPTKVHFRNSSKDKVYLYKVNGFTEGRIENNLFIIEGKNGRVPYKGLYFKRREPKLPGDFVELLPGGVFVALVRLADAYDFPPGPGQGIGRYQARYEAIDPSPPEGPLREMRSNEVAFDLPP